MTEEQKKKLEKIVSDFEAENHIEVKRTENRYFIPGKLERKGSYIMELSDLSYDLPIVNEALINYMTKDIPVEKTINDCNEMIKFQKVFRMTSSYKCAWHNGKYLANKTYRVFASLDKSDTYLGKCREMNGNPDKFGDCPEHCFIFNKSLKDVPLSIKIDKKWYIKLAKKRLTDFGFEMKIGNALF